MLASSARTEWPGASDAPAERPRLLLLTPDFPPDPGGIQAIAHRLAGEMKGFDIRVVALDGPGARSFDAASGLSIRRVPIGALRGPARVGALNAYAFAQALRFRPDLTLNAHIVTAPVSTAIRRALGAPVVQYYHANEIGDKPRLAEFAARRADVVIAVSSYTAGLIKASGGEQADIRLIPPGVELPVDPTPQPAARPTLLTIARMNDGYKGHDVLIRALALVRERVPGALLIVVGDGPLRAGLEQLVESLELSDAVRFLGSVSDRQRDEWLRRADVFAMPSRLPGGRLAGEGFGIVYLEAAAYGKPVVAGNVAGALDSVADGETGLLVDPTDPQAVADAITTLLVDRDLARRLGERGAERAASFAWPRIAARVEAVALEQVERARARALST